MNLLLSVLDYTKFLDLRNGTAILLMYRCGLRIGTIARMKWLLSLFGHSSNYPFGTLLTLNGGGGGRFNDHVSPGAWSEEGGLAGVLGGQNGEPGKSYSSVLMGGAALTSFAPGGGVILFTTEESR